MLIYVTKFASFKNSVYLCTHKTIKNKFKNKIKMKAKELQNLINELKSIKKELKENETLLNSTNNCKEYDFCLECLYDTHYKLLHILEEYANNTREDMKTI